MLAIWQACAQRARKRVFLQFGRRVYLPFGRHVCSAERAHLSGCAYHLAGMCAACGRAGVLTIWQA